MSYRNRRAGRLAGRVTAVTAALTLAVLGAGAASALAGANTPSAVPPVAAAETVGGITTVDDYGYTYVGKGAGFYPRVSVLSNDTGDGLTVLSVVGATGQESGTATVVGGASISWTPADSTAAHHEDFIYTVQDSSGTTATGVVHFSVRDMPVALDHEITLPMRLWDQSNSEEATWVEYLAENPRYVALAEAGQASIPAPRSYLYQALDLDMAVGSFTGYYPDGWVFLAGQGVYGDYTFTYQITDTLFSNVVSNVGTITVHLLPPSLEMIAVTTFGTPIKVPVLEKDETGLGWIDSIVSDPENGAVEIIDGETVYTPQPGFYGVDTYTARIKVQFDGVDYISVLDVVVKVTVLEPQVITDLVDYNTPKSIDLASTGTTDITSFGQAEHGTVEMVNGELVYTPTPGYVGEDSFAVSGLDADGQLTSVTVELTVAPPADQQLSTSTPFETPKTIDVVGETGGTSVGSVGQGSNGTVTIVDGEVVYTPNPGFSGADSFTVAVLDEYGTPHTVVVDVTVGEEIAASAQTPYETPVTVDVLDQTSATELTGTGQGENGTAEIVDGQLVYTPNPGFVGEDTVMVTVVDENGETVEVPVTITVAGPEAVELNTSTPYQTPKTVDVLGESGAESIDSVGTAGNGTVEIVDGVVVYTPTPGFSGEDSFTATVLDEHGTPVEVIVTVTVDEPLTAEDTVDYNTPKTIDVPGESVTGVEDGANGTVTIDEGGNVIYTPNPGFIGEDTFPVTVIGEDGEPDTVIVTVTVAGPDPVEISTTTPFETPKTVDVLDETGAETIASVGQGENGTVEIVDGEVVYTPNPGFIGEDSFTVTVTDEYGNDIEVTVDVTVGDVVHLAEDTDYNTPVISDPVAETDGGTVSEVTDGDNGTVTVNDDGTVTYTPNPGFVGEDHYTVIVTDDEGNSTAVIVDVTVAGPEDGTAEAGTDYNTPVEVDVTENDGDTVTGATDGDNGTVTTNPDGTVTYTPNPGFVGEDEFTVTITDEFGNEHDVTVTVTVDGPPATEVTDSTGYETPKDIDVIGDSGDTISGTGQGENGSVTINPDGTVTYTPNLGFSGEDSFTVTVVDEFGTERKVIVTVTVSDPARVDLASETPFETSKSIDVLGETGAESISSVTQGQNGTVTIVDGKVVYTPNPGFSGTDTFTVTVINADGTRTVVTITMTVGDPAVAPGDTGNGGQGVRTGVLAITGSDAGLLGLIGAGVAALGVALTMATRRRRGSVQD
ncbi:Ig-like domain-containing protein [Cellulomonas sp. NPDC089187]|uniref:Ig-like domain-containing protein n=1 Tax=Cellulomonas sp. NPDC089187 TaxID=3154970 RepID=UPI003426584C